MFLEAKESSVKSGQIIIIYILEEDNYTGAAEPSEAPWSLPLWKVDWLLCKFFFTFCDCELGIDRYVFVFVYRCIVAFAFKL